MGGRRRPWICDHCGKRGPWSKGWKWYPGIESRRNWPGYPWVTCSAECERATDFGTGAA